LTAPLLQLESITRSFGKLRAVNNLSFEMGKGEIFGFIGPNGAGKTTTMRILATLDLPDRGDAFVEGMSVLAEPRKVHNRVGFMSDRFQAYPNLDVIQYLDFFARAYGLRGKKRIATVRSVATFCGLDTFADRPATGLSKGMGQRLHLAKTLLHDPALLILDEPAAGLDPHARIEFRELLRELAAAGKGVLISSHILSELSETCDGVIVIEKGKKVVSGKIGEIAEGIKKHRHVQVRLLGDAEEAERWFLTQPLVTDVHFDGVFVTFDFQGNDEQMAELLARAIAAEIKILEFRQRQAGLEEIFLSTTKGNLQ